VLQTGASAVGLGELLKQDGDAVAYVSWQLTVAKIMTAVLLKGMFGGGVCPQMVLLLVA